MSAISSISLPSVSLYSVPSVQSSAVVANAADAASAGSSSPATEVSGATAKLGLHNEAIIGALIQSLLISSRIGTVAPASLPAESAAPPAPTAVNQVS